MFTSDCLNINEKGHLTIGGCDTVDLANEYGTPLYVLDENTIRNTCKAYVSSFAKYYDGNGMPMYASKALSCLELCRIVNEEGLGLDVVSGGELYTALKAGVPAENIHFHGNNRRSVVGNRTDGSPFGAILTDLNFTRLCINRVPTGSACA